MPANPVEISPQNLARLLDTKQYGTLHSVREGVNALSRLALDLDRHGFAVLAESLSYVLRQIDACIDEEAAAAKESSKEAEAAIARSEQLEDEVRDLEDELNQLKARLEAA